LIYIEHGYKRPYGRLLLKGNLMPELPEVETIVRGLRKAIVGKKIRNVRVIFPGIVKQDSRNLKKNLDKGEIKGIRRRGKFILVDLSNGKTILAHLGMTGSFLFLKSSIPLNKHDHLILKFYKTQKELRYNDQRKFGRIKSFSASKEENIFDLKKLGPEPLNISSADFVSLFKKRKGRIKSALLNQQIIAGLGNIYADESLFEAKIHPAQRADKLNPHKLKRLHQAIRKILKRAIKAGGSSIENYCNINGEIGNFQFQHKVYGREGLSCKKCRTKIKRIKISQRSSYFCPRCQVLSI
jgi:formamidopyrimidine-DNA glycosylase